MFSKKLLLAILAAVLCAAALFAQAPPAKTPDGGQPSYIKPETLEQRRARLGTADDPGIDPDPSKHFWRFGKSYHIEKFDRRWESYEGAEPGSVRPFGYVNLYREIYQRNEKWVWVWMPDTTPQE